MILQVQKEVVERQREGGEGSNEGPGSNGSWLLVFLLIGQE